MEARLELHERDIVGAGRKPFDAEGAFRGGGGAAARLDVASADADEDACDRLTPSGHPAGEHQAAAAEVEVEHRLAAARHRHSAPRAPSRLSEPADHVPLAGGDRLDAVLALVVHPALGPVAIEEAAASCTGEGGDLELRDLLGRDAADAPPDRASPVEAELEPGDRRGIHPQLVRQRRGGVAGLASGEPVGAGRDSFEAEGAGGVARRLGPGEDAAAADEVDGGLGDRPPRRVDDRAGDLEAAAQPQVEAILARRDLEVACRARPVVVLGDDRARPRLHPLEAVGAVAVGHRPALAGPEGDGAALLEDRDAGARGRRAVSAEDAAGDHRPAFENDLRAPSGPRPRGPGGRPVRRTRSRAPGRRASWCPA